MLKEQNKKGEEIFRSVWCKVIPPVVADYNKLEMMIKCLNH